MSDELFEVNEWWCVVGHHCWFESNDYAMSADCADVGVLLVRLKDAWRALTKGNLARDYSNFLANLFFRITYIFCPPRHHYIFPNRSRHT
jgi:hypothetical protein